MDREHTTKLLYRGKKSKIGPCRVNVSEEFFEVVRYPPVRASHDLYHVKRHSIDGFQWGYGGSGPSDLALSILTDYCKTFKIQDTEIPNKFYQRFKDNFISNVKDDIHITSDQIEKWLENVQKTNESIVEKHKEFIKIITPIIVEQITKLDPIGLLKNGFSAEAYETEIQDIIVRLQTSEYNFLSLSEIMYIIFAYKYGMEEAKPESQYLLPAQQIIKQLQEQKNENNKE